MTWEEKLFELLEIEEVQDFTSDSNMSSLLDISKSPNEMFHLLERQVKSGNIEKFREILPEFTSIYNKWKQILKHCRKNPACVNWDRRSYRYMWRNGKFGIGYHFAEKGLKGFDDSLLKWSRIIRDGEKRCLKHPRFRQT